MMVLKMKMDLHCNLPYNPIVPNASLGYIKGFLINKDIKVRNIYWNLLYYNIISKYQLFEKFQRVSDIVPITTTTTFLCKYLYEKNNWGNHSTTLSSIFEKIINKNELKKLINEIEDFTDRYIEENKLDEVDIAGFTLKSYQWLMNYYIILNLKERNPDIKIIIGGLNSQSKAIEYMRHFPEVDFSIWGEGEIPIYEFIKNINHPSFYKKIPNLIFRNKSKIEGTFSIYQNGNPDRSMFPFADHNDYFDLIKKLKIDKIIPRIPIWGIRTCQWNKCKFCIVDNENIYVERTPENIVKEIEFQTNKHDANCIYFVDNDFGRRDRESFDQLLKLLYESSNKQNKPYDIIAEISPLRLDRESISLMKKISIQPVQIGFEAVNDEILKKINKNHRFIDNLQALKLADEEDFMISGINVIMGIPSETKKDVINSISNLKFLRFLLKKYPLTLIKLILYKGSPFYDDLPSYEKEKWDQSILWDEINKLNFLDSDSKFEFFGFNKVLIHDYLWKYFDLMLNYYMSSNFSYKWIIKPDGSSIVDTDECKYHLDPIETEILMYCDTIKIYTDLKKFFINLKEENMKNILSQLYKIGLLYYDKDCKRLLSILSCNKKSRFI